MWCVLCNPGSQQEIGGTFKSGKFGVKVRKETGPPRWLSGEESACQCRRCGFDPWVTGIPWRRKWQPIPVLLAEKSYRQRSLAGYCPWGHKESDKTGHSTAMERLLSLGQGSQEQRFGPPGLVVAGPLGVHL